MPYSDLLDPLHYSNDTHRPVVKVGDKVAHRALSGPILGVVTGVDRAERTVTMRVTARTNRFYRCGEVLTRSPLFLQQRG